VCEGAVVRDCVIMAGCVIKRGAYVEYAILGEGGIVPESTSVGGPKSDGHDLTLYISIGG